MSLAAAIRSARRRRAARPARRGLALDRPARPDPRSAAGLAGRRRRRRGRPVRRAGRATPGRRQRPRRRAVAVDRRRGQVVALRLRFAAATASHAAELASTSSSARRLTLLESYEGEAAAIVAQTSPRHHARRGRGGRAHRAGRRRRRGRHGQPGRGRLAPGATFGQTMLTAGARRQRLETRVSHPGGHAPLRLDGVYLLADKRHADLTTVVTTTAPTATTDAAHQGRGRATRRAASSRAGSSSSRGRRPHRRAHGPPRPDPLRPRRGGRQAGAGDLRRRRRLRARQHGRARWTRTRCSTPASAAFPRPRRAPC